jgi:hypothetical protein
VLGVEVQLGILKLYGERQTVSEVCEAVTITVDDNTRQMGFAMPRSRGGGAMHEDPRREDQVPELSREINLGEPL